MRAVVAAGLLTCRLGTAQESRPHPSLGTALESRPYPSLGTALESRTYPSLGTALESCPYPSLGTAQESRPYPSLGTAQESCPYSRARTVLVHGKARRRAGILRSLEGRKQRRQILPGVALALDGHVLEHRILIQGQLHGAGGAYRRQALGHQVEVGIEDRHLQGHLD